MKARGLTLTAFLVLLLSGVALGDEDPQGFSHYHRIYFLYGSPDVRAQISFKIRPAAPYSFFFGYDQVLFWDLKTDSRPIEEVDFNPHFFYRLRPENAFFGVIDLGLYDHLSNGKSGPDSRSVQEGFIRVEHRSSIFGSSHFGWITRLNAIYGIDPATPDFRDYWGPLSMRLSLSDFFIPGQEDETIYVQFRSGGKFAQDPGRGALEMGLLVPVFGSPFRHTLMFQFFHGYGESILTYREQTTSFRAGLLF